jgi:hypothetical protein
MADDDRSAARRGGRKDRKLEQFVEGLLSTPTVESAAARAGISARTAWRWMQDPAVVQRLAEARRQGMQHAMTRLQAAASRSVACLCEVPQDGESESALFTLFCHSWRKPLAAVWDVCKSAKIREQRRYGR